MSVETVSVIPELEGKYIVIIMDCNNYNVETLGTFCEQRDALQFMSLAISHDEKIQGPWYEKVYDNEYQISIYERGWFSKKGLIYRFFIKSY